MRLVRAPFALAALLALALLAAAPTGNASRSHCGILVVELGTGEAPTAYVVFDADPVWFWFTPWVYAESNGIPHLQRGGATLLNDVDPCPGELPPDTGVF